ncbi:YfaP family protein [Bizionia myxarmorum]|uniref:DUF4382 domain-containing protein n=1 Tax=Bizionia myxarmorum TaxID=291186 RepID=A0A5D0RBZ7_9FLAO|nr:hypothetical protein [Bizionia myxarmorum]TYB79067.1 hypothetical protein ES674_04625 [Bizionia myxarmorum]
MKLNFLRSLSLALVSVVIFSCSSDDDQVEVVIPSVNGLFNVQDATLQTNPFPAANSDMSLEILSINANVIPGGTSYATIQTSTPARKLLIGAIDRMGYYEMLPENNADLNQNFILKINQLITENRFSVILAYLDDNNHVSQPVYADLLVTTVGTGALQVSLSFDNDKDVDLHLIEPNGDHIYYGNMNSANGGFLDLDSNPACSIDGINNENIFYSDDATLEAGIYYVYVDMYENCNADVATNFVASVYLNGVEIPTSTQNPFAGNFPVGFPSNSGGSDIANDIAPVFSFEILEDGSRASRTGRKMESISLSPSAIKKLEKSNNR